jgi:hypothetical protein
LWTADFSQVATALGARVVRVEEPGHRRDALKGAFAHTEGPVVVDMVVEPYVLSLPSQTRAATVKGLTLSLAIEVMSGKMDDVIDTAEHLSAVVSADRGDLPCGHADPPAGLDGGRSRGTPRLRCPRLPRCGQRVPR